MSKEILFMHYIYISFLERQPNKDAVWKKIDIGSWVKEQMNILLGCS